MSDSETELRQRPGDQPLPQPNQHPAIADLVQADLEARRELGIQRYGTPLQPFNGRDALRDLHEELLDGACYIRQAIHERDTMPSPIVIDMGQVSTEDLHAWEEAWNAADTTGPPRIVALPTDAFVLRRRTPEARRAYLTEHRDEAIAKGIPADLVDMMIDDTA